MHRAPTDRFRLTWRAVLSLIGAALVVLIATGGLTPAPAPAPAPVTPAGLELPGFDTDQLHQWCVDRLGPRTKALSAAARTFLTGCRDATELTMPGHPPTPTPTPTPVPTTPSPGPTPTGPAASWPTAGATAAGSTGWRHTG